jgi:hypothetical protein
MPRIRRVYLRRCTEAESRTTREKRMHKTAVAIVLVAVLAALIGASYSAARTSQPAGDTAIHTRSAHTVKRFAIRSAEYFTRTYYGVSLTSGTARCRKSGPVRWNCQVNLGGGECTGLLKLLDEGPGGPPLYILENRIGCAE